MSEEQNDGQEKTVDATPHRIQKAREEGNVPQSKDVHAAAAYLGVLLALVLFAGSSIEVFGELATAFVAKPQEVAAMLSGPGGRGATAAIFAGFAVSAAPLFLIPALGVVLSLVSQRAVVFSSTKIMPKVSRISPVSNAKQKYGATGMVEFLKSAVKLAALSIIVGTVAFYQAPEYVMMAQLDGRILGARLGEETVLYLGVVTLVAIVIGAVDYFWQQYDHLKKLRMSHQELKDEMKHTEGDPAMKQRRREKAQSIATNKMLTKVPEADVIIVNPTHYAVALTWSRKRGEAPVCVAKGVDEIAARIREIAAEHQIPVHRDPPTARALHAVVELEQEIPEEHYRAVAVAIRFADDVRAKARKKKD